MTIIITRPDRVCWDHRNARCVVKIPPRHASRSSRRHRLAPDEARAITRALLAGALLADNRLDDANLNFDDGASWVL